MSTGGADGGGGGAGSAAGTAAGDSGSSSYATMMREQDRFLPMANIARIMKQTLPDNAKISKEARETIQECVSEFISFLASEYPLAATASRVHRGVGSGQTTSGSAGKLP